MSSKGAKVGDNAVDPQAEQLAASAQAAEPRKLDPSTMSQEQLMRLCEVILAINRTNHPARSRERAAYDASLGMAASAHGPWWRRILGRIVKWKNERVLRRLDAQHRRGGP